jgi:nickel/cobalt exporter
LLRLFALLACVLVALVPQRAAAHPHIFIEATSEVLVDGQGRVTGVRQRWAIDEMFSAQARQGFGDLNELRDTMMSSLAEYAFFTRFSSGTRILPAAPPRDPTIEVDGAGQIVLGFVVPLAEPASAEAGPVTVRLVDPEYFVAFDMPDNDPVRLAAGAAPSCRFELSRPRGLDATTSMELSQLPQSQRDLPPQFQSSGLADLLAYDTSVTCGAARPGAAAPVAPAARGPGPFGVGTTPEPGFAPRDFGPLAPMIAWIAARQAELYRQFGAAIRAVREDWTAAAMLILLAFLYGVLHAAGPGHGKAVISSYLLASQETLRRGALISLASAFMQGLTAVVLVGLLAIVLQATSVAMGRVSAWLDVASYALITLLGAVLVGRKLWAMRPRRPAVSLSAAAVTQGDPCCAAHAIDPRRLEGPFDLKAAGAAILAVGLRPCTGAVILLVFALGQGLFGLGVLAVAAMSLGTGMTVAALATLAVGAKGLAVRLAARRTGLAIAIGHGAELAGAVLVFAFGAIFLAAALVSRSL